jgi:stearoyl-CoA desaturase (delta-9 desaturase)
MGLEIPWSSGVAFDPRWPTSGLQAPTGQALTRPKRKLDWTNTLFLVGVHVLGLFGLYWMAFVHFSLWTLALGLLWFAFCGVSITGGYHRLFSHPTYKATWPLRLFYLLFGAASVQNSALKWSADHRTHHGNVDTEADPYNINQGFWWAHIGWVLFQTGGQPLDNVGDLKRDPLVRFQHTYYVPLAIVFGALLPIGLGFLWGDPIGALLVAGCTRLMFQYHATFAVNSFAHYSGTQPYSTKTSARDSFITAILTLGEGYHNFHHSFQMDYRNGVRWWQLDPTKWLVWSLSKCGVTKDLRRVPTERIRAALTQGRETSAA